MESEQKINIIENILKPLKQNPNCYQHYKNYLEELRHIAKAFQNVQLGYAQFFKRISQLEKQVEETRIEWKSKPSNLS